MTPGRRRKSIAFFIVLGICLSAGVFALNVGWVIVSWQNVGLLVIGLLVFPLVICFLPGIFVSTLAPVIYQMIQVANSVLRSTGR